MKLNNRGDIAVSMLTVMIVLMAAASLICEYMRVHTLQSKTEQQLIQAVNVALEASMHDSHRQDSTSAIDIQIARDAFYSYLYYDMGMDSSYRLYGSDGNLVYRLESANLTFVDMPPAITFSCVMKAPSMFSFFTSDIVVPFDIKSRNGRID